MGLGVGLLVGLAWGIALLDLGWVPWFSFGFICLVWVGRSDGWWVGLVGLPRSPSLACFI